MLGYGRKIYNVIMFPAIDHLFQNPSAQVVHMPSRVTDDYPADGRKPGHRRGCEPVMYLIPQRVALRRGPVLDRVIYQQDVRSHPVDGRAHASGTI